MGRTTAIVKVVAVKLRKLITNRLWACDSFRFTGGKVSGYLSTCGRAECACQLGIGPLQLILWGPFAPGALKYHTTKSRKLITIIIINIIIGILH
jgi:hypothetical protein